MKSFQFLMKNDIEFLPMLIKYNTSEKKKEILIYETQLILGYTPTMKDFFEKSPMILKKRQDDFLNNYDRYCQMADEMDSEAWWVCALNTQYTFIIDIDHKDVVSVFEPLLTTHPYYLSTSKNLPKLFFTDKNLIMDNRKNIKYMNDMVEVQKGQWSFIDVETEVKNSELSIPHMDFNKFIEPHNKKSKPHRIMLQVPLQRDVAELIEIPLSFIQYHTTFKLCECLDLNKWENWDDWFKIGCALKSARFAYSFHVWKYFSSKSGKYEEENWRENGKDKATWDNIKVMDGGITIGSLHHWAKEDNLELYTDYFGKSYDKVKERQEKILFKVNSPPVFGVIDVDNKLCILSEEKIKTRFRDVWYEELGIDKRTGEKQIQEKPFINKWLTCPNKRCYEKIIFDPKPHTDPRMYNIFDGFVAPNEGEYKQEHIDIINQYILTRLCGNDTKFHKFFLMWLAHIIQKPWDKTRVCIVIKSIQGVGKNLFTNFFGNMLLGKKYYIPIVNMREAVGRFNNTLENKIFVNLNEVELKDTIDSQGLLKAYITDDLFQLERKNIDRICIANHMNFIATTNKDTPFAIEYSDRRFACVETKSPALTDEEIQFFTKFFKDKDVAYSFYQFLLNYELPTTRLEKLRPETEYYNDCKIVVASPVLKYLANEMEQSLLKPEYFITYESLYSRYRDYITQYYHTDKKIINLSSFKLKLKDIPGIEKERRRVEGERLRGVIINTEHLKHHLKTLHLYED